MELADHSYFASLLLQEGLRLSRSDQAVLLKLLSPSITTAGRDNGYQRRPKPASVETLSSGSSFISGPIKHSSRSRPYIVSKPSSRSKARGMIGHLTRDSHLDDDRIAEKCKTLRTASEYIVPGRQAVNDVTAAAKGSKRSLSSISRLRTSCIVSTEPETLDDMASRSLKHPTHSRAMVEERKPTMMESETVAPHDLVLRSAAAIFS